MIAAGILPRHDVPAAGRIPYRAHVAPRLVRTEHGEYVQAFRLGGANFETCDDVDLNLWHERLNVLWRNVAAPNVALWTHVVRLPAALPAPQESTATADFAARLEAGYRRRMAGESLWVNELYLAAVYRHTADPVAGTLSRWLSRAQRGIDPREIADAVDACDKLAKTIAAGLERYDPQPLGIYRHETVWCSSLLEYLALLVNGERLRMPLPRGPVNEALSATRLIFGSETIEYRASTATRVGAMLGIKEYPTPSVVAMFDRLLAAPFPFVMTQSFAFLAKATAQGLLQRQGHRLRNAGDFALSQAEELHEALDALTSNEFCMGDHHFSLQILDEPQGGGAEEPRHRLQRLNERLALARALLADTGMLVAREDLALEAAFWAQLPGQFGLRPRKSAITSRNFAAMAPFHAYPGGRATGNHWGDALTVLVTSARSPYHFSLHAGDPRDPDGGRRKDTGHTLICGPTGSGKTVLIAFLVAMLARRGVRQVLFDKDRGLEILVRALGGQYLALRNGMATGFNPLQLPCTPTHLEFLRHWLRVLGEVGHASPEHHRTTAREEADLEQALRGTLALEPSARRLSRLLEFLDPTDPGGLHARLSRWCATCRGDYAWAFDHPEDTFEARTGHCRVVGIDVTEFLDHPRARTPITLYLFHRVRSLLDGRPFVCWMDEFWRLLADPAFESFAKDGPKTWRKLNGVMCLATQSVSDVLDSPISRTLVEQTPTKIFFPNDDADPREYADGMGLRAREFDLLCRGAGPASRQFLLKQGPGSLLCQLDLRGFEAELAVLSGRRDRLERLERLMAAHGEAPERWLDAFLAAERPLRSTSSPGDTHV